MVVEMEEKREEKEGVIGGRLARTIALEEGNEHRCQAHFPGSKVQFPAKRPRIHCLKPAIQKIVILNESGEELEEVFVCQNALCPDKAVRLKATAKGIPEIIEKESKKHPQPRSRRIWQNGRIGSFA